MFAGGWTLEAAEVVAGADILEALASLLDKSLVLSEEQASGLRYRMLETVREYALEKLRESGKEEEARARHADYYPALGEQAHPFLAKPERVWLDRLEGEHGNLQVALTTHAAQAETIDKAVRLATALQTFWHARGHYYEHRVWLVGLALRPTPPTRARAQMLAWAAPKVAGDGDSFRAKQMLTEMLEIGRQLGDRRDIAAALYGLAGFLSDPGIAGAEYDPNAARPFAEESLAMMQEEGDKQGMAHNLFLLGRVARQVGNNAQAYAYWTECQALDEELGVKGGYVLPALADLAQESGDYAAAHRFFERFLTERHEIGDRWSVAWGLQQASALDLAEGQPERAAQLLGASLALRASANPPLSPEEHERYDRLRDTLRKTLGAPALATAWEAGHAMTISQAIEFALKEHPA